MAEKRSITIMVIFPILGGAAIGSFSIQRYSNGEYLNAIFDLVIGFSFLALSAYTYFTGKEKIARYISAFLTVAGPLAFLKQFDSTFIYWIYSSVIILFYLLDYKWALALNLLMLLGVALMIPADNYRVVELTSMTVTILLIVSFSLIFALTEDRSKKRLKILSLIDDLTGIGNRRAFVTKITEAINLRKRHNLAASLLYVDIDKFKLINDSLGHAVGDAALVGIATSIKSKLRETDSVFRIGGDEFVIIAEGADHEAGTQLAEKIRSEIQSETIVEDYPVTVSMGVASLNDEDTTDTWIARADTELYRAKATGRNRVNTAEFA